MYCTDDESGGHLSALLNGRKFSQKGTLCTLWAGALGAARDIYVLDAQRAWQAS